MPVEIRMPQWGMAMQEGAVLRWFKQVGEEVAADETLVEIESAKTAAEVPSPVSGVVTQILVAEGDTVPCQTLLAVVSTTGEETAAAPATEPAPAPAADAAPAQADVGGGVQVVPQARKLAKELGVDLATVTGSGTGGRIVSEDVRRAHEQQQSGAAPAQPAAPAAPAAGPAPMEAVAVAERTPLRGMRRVIAQRMHASLRDTAQLTLMRSVSMDAAVGLRSELVEAWASEGVRPSFTDLIALAAVRAMTVHPRLNSSLVEEAAGPELVVHGSVNLGLAVALDDGLVVPVIRGAEALSLRQLCAANADVATRARNGELTPDDYTGGTFTVSALGSAGIDWFTPVLNPPESLLLGVGRILDTWRMGADGPVPAKEVALSLTIDHRVVDGAAGAAYLATLAELLEQPLRLLG